MRNYESAVFKRCTKAKKGMKRGEKKGTKRKKNLRNKEKKAALNN